MFTSGSTPPTRDISAGCSIEESLRSRVLSTVADDLRRGAVHHRDPVRHLGLLRRRQPGEQQRGLVRGHVRQHQRDHLGVLVGDERPQLGGVGTVQELERHLHRSGLDPLDDLGGTVGARGTARAGSGRSPGPPWAMCARAVIMSRNSASTCSVSALLIDSSRAISARDRLDLGVGEVAEHARRRGPGPSG